MRLGDKPNCNHVLAVISFPVLDTVTGAFVLAMAIIFGTRVVFSASFLICFFIAEIDVSVAFSLERYLNNEKTF